MNTILLPTTGSSDDLSVIEYAISTFGNSLKFILLSGFTCDFAQGKKEDGTRFATREEQHATLSFRTLEVLETQKSLLIKKFGKTEIECLAIEGSELQSIYSTILRRDVDLVVIGTKVSKRSYSSTLASRLIGNLKAHILVVPYHTKPIPIDRMVITYSDLELSSSIFGPLNYLVNKFDPICTMLNLNFGKVKTHKSSVIAAALADFIGVKNYTDQDIPSKHIVESIMDYCAELEPKLLVTFTQEESYIEDFWTGSEIDELSHFLQQPMLVLWED